MNQTVLFRILFLLFTGYSTLIAELLKPTIGGEEKEILKISGKRRIYTIMRDDSLIYQVNGPARIELITRYPSPKKSKKNEGLKALIFDSIYDSFKGAIAYVKVFNGQINKGQKLYFYNSKTEIEAIDIGFLKPNQVSSNSLKTGLVGYIETGIKNLKDIKVGDTIFDVDNKNSKPLIGYKESSPTVYTGLYPVDSDRYQELRDALDKLFLNDPSLVYEPETSAALGFGFRCGFLGPLHMEIIQERLEREFGMNLISFIFIVAG